MCGASENTIGCQTCSRCYHTHCMFPPLEASQLPDVWFCPVCVGRNWHVPPATTQAPPIAPSGSPLLSNHLQSANFDGTKQPDNISVSNAVDIQSPNRGPPADQNDNSETRDQRWKQNQRWKERSWYTPPGYILDSISAERFIPLCGDGPSIPFSTVMRNHSGSLDEIQSHPTNSSSIPGKPQGRPRRRGKAERTRSPLRKRSKYSELPVEIEKALDLIKDRLESASRYNMSRDDVKTEAQALEQKMKIREGELLLCRHELQSVKQKLSTETADMETVRAENVELRKEMQELRASAQITEDQLKNWQNMLRQMMGADSGPSTS